MLCVEMRQKIYQIIQYRFTPSTHNLKNLMTILTHIYYVTGLHNSSLYKIMNIGMKTKVLITCSNL